MRCHGGGTELQAVRLSECLCTIRSERYLHYDSGREANVLICIINRAQLGTISAIVKEYPDRFAVMNQVSQVMGNFYKMDKTGQMVTDLLDSGDRKTL